MTDLSVLYILETLVPGNAFQFGVE